MKHIITFRVFGVKAPKTIPAELSAFAGIIHW